MSSFVFEGLSRVGFVNISWLREKKKSGNRLDVKGEGERRKERKAIHAPK